MQDSLFPVMCYGKLPGYGEFIRYNANSPEMQALDQWIQKGLFFAKTRLDARWEIQYFRAPLLHFIFFPENSRSFLAGTLKSSCDRSGRKYPFLTALRADAMQFDSRFRPLAPVILREFFSTSAPFLRDRVSRLDAAEIAPVVQELSRRVPYNFYSAIQPYREFLTRTALSELWSHRGNGRLFEKRFVIFNNLAEVLLPLRQQDLSRISLVLRIPLASRPESCPAEVSFWQEVIQQFIGTPGNFCPSLFWTDWAAGMPDYLFLHFRTPSPRSFSLMFDETLEDDSLCKIDVGYGRGGQTAEQALEPRLRTILQNANISLGDLIQRLW